VRRFIPLTLIAVSLQAAETVTVPAAVIEDKIRGGLLGEIVGDLNGLAHENKYILEPGNVARYVPALPEGAWTDDDTDIEWIYLIEMERSRTLLVPPQRIAELWKRHINRRIWCSHRYLRQLLEIGIEPPLTGSVHVNPWANFNLSGQFVSESWGLISPGMPRTAAKLALHYVHTSIDLEPAQSAQIFSSMIAVAFLTNDVTRILDAGAAAADPRSEMRHIVDDVRRWHGEKPGDFRATRRNIQQKYSIHPERVYQIDMNGVKLNGACTIAALLYGKGDFAETVRHAFNCGWDADNNAATAGTIIGVTKGYRWMMDQGWQIADKYRNTSRDGLPNETITRYGDRLVALAWQNIREQGGSVGASGGRECRIRTQTALNRERLPDPAEQLARLRETYATQIEAAIRRPGSPQQAARAAYLAIALDLAVRVKEQHPGEWRDAAAALSKYSGLMQVLFYDSPGEAGELLRERARTAGLAAPAREEKE